MRKFSIILFSLFLSYLCFGVKNSYAFIICPELPFCPTCDALNNSTLLNNTKTAIATIKENKHIYTEMKRISELKGMDIVYAAAESDLISSFNKKSLDGTKKLTENSRNLKKSPKYDIYSQESVQTKLFSTLMIRESDKKADISCFNNQRKNFYRDSLLEVVASTEELKSILDDLDKELSTFEETLKNGNKNIAGVDTNQGVYEMQYQASDIMDKITRIQTELAAMDVMAKMSIILKNEITPISAAEANLVKKEKEDKKNKSDKVSS